MFLVEDKERIVKEFIEGATANIDTNVTEDIVGYMTEGNVGIVKDCILKVHINVLAAVPDEVEVPCVSLYQSPLLSEKEEEGINIISLVVSNRVNSTKKFRYATRVSKVSLLQKLKDFFISAYVELIVSSMVDANLERVNDILSQATAEAEVPYKVSFVSNLGYANKKITSILDDEIIFVADTDRALSINDLMLLREPSEEDLITEEMIQDSYAALVKEIANCQTVEQLVEKPGAFIRYVGDLSKYVKPATLIKAVCSKNVEKLKGNKDTLAYFLRGNTFALIAKREGNLEVVLSPFDLKTLRKVEIDVLQEIEDGMVESQAV